MLASQCSCVIQQHPSSQLLTWLHTIMPADQTHASANRLCLACHTAKGSNDDDDVHWTCLATSKEEGCCCGKMLFSA